MSLAVRRNTLLFTLACALAFFVVFWALTGVWPIHNAPYNTYLLQSNAWLSGRLDLGEDFSHLELAVYNGNYYCSFPPMPSILLLPLAALFGVEAPDGLLAVLGIAAICCESLALMRELGKPERSCAFWTLFLLIGSNTSFICATGWVWFLAQNLSFAFTLAALRRAMRNDIGISLFLLVCAAGCRPFQAVYLPIVIYAWLCHNKAGLLLSLRRWRWWILAACALAFVYCALNAARFGNPLEFGHNYLPEFQESENGQFSISYIAANAGRLTAFPTFENGRLVLEKFNGSALWLSMPILISFIWYAACYAVKPSNALQKSTAVRGGLIPIAFCCLLIHAVALLSHKTLGGWHFGNRYFVDLLACVFLLIGYVSAAKDKLLIYQVPLFIFGICINICAGTAVLNHWV